MVFCDELYFEINFSGVKSELKKLIRFLKSGGLDEFFEVSEDFICPDDYYDEASDSDECTVVFTNDDIGIEIDEIRCEDLLETLCRAARNVDARGRIYDVEDDEYSFVSREGDDYYLNADKIDVFNDELDERAREEEAEED